MHAIWRRVGFRPTDRRAMLRGIPVDEPPHWRDDHEERAHIYSNLYLTSGVARIFAEAMVRQPRPIPAIYPSSLIVFARYAQELDLELPRFDAILTSSENLSPSQRRQIEEFYGCRVFEWYGHSENLILAAQCERSDAYHIVPEYGVAEVVTAEGAASEEGAEGELVGTTLYNYAMPLVRYRTGDWATVGPSEGCECGRQHALLDRITGRRANDVVVGRAGNLIPLLAVDPYTPSFDRVVQVQFVQEREGELELHVVRGEGFSDRDSQEILASTRDVLGSSLDVRLVFCDEIPLTPAGKHRLLIQRLPIAAGS